jgi:hypothetical protein
MSAGRLAVMRSLLLLGVNLGSGDSIVPKLTYVNGILKSSVVMNIIVPCCSYREESCK